MGKCHYDMAKAIAEDLEVTAIIRNQGNLPSYLRVSFFELSPYFTVNGHVYDSKGDYVSEFNPDSWLTCGVTLLSGLKDCVHNYKIKHW